MSSKPVPSFTRSYALSLPVAELRSIVWPAKECRDVGAENLLLLLQDDRAESEGIPREIAHQEDVRRFIERLDRSSEDLRRLERSLQIMRRYNANRGVKITRAIGYAPAGSPAAVRNHEIFELARPFRERMQQSAVLLEQLRAFKQWVTVQAQSESIE